MPAPVDHDARRAVVSEAVWGVLGDHGFGGLTIRAVAARMGVSTGLISHYFPDKRALLRHAVGVALERTALTTPPPGSTGRERLRAAMLRVLDDDPAMARANRVWISFWDAALHDAELAELQVQRYDSWRTRLAVHVRTGVADGSVRADLGGYADVDDVAVAAAAFAHGLVVQSAFDREGFPPDRLAGLVDTFLAGLSPAG